MQELELEKFVVDEEVDEEPYSTVVCRTIAVIVWFVSALHFFLAVNWARFVEFDVVSQMIPYCWACLIVSAAWILVKVRSRYGMSPDIGL
ncbi:MAG: hypothetical protein JSW05_06080 [Candidatus Thorarchaeota archaeon]|nr:MAG: hypothetical protein JSW05_06080 [Candidatus Thorarchaeota archaeon]